MLNCAQARNDAGVAEEINHFFKKQNDSVLFPLYFKIEESTRINYPIVQQFQIILPKAIRSLKMILSEEDRLCDEMTA